MDYVARISTVTIYGYICKGVQSSHHDFPIALKDAISPCNVNLAAQKDRNEFVTNCLTDSGQSD